MNDSDSTIQRHGLGGPPWRWIAAACFALIGLSGVAMFAQAESPDPTEAVKQSDDSRPGGATTAPAPQSDAVQYTGPDTYILLDASGHPQMMPGMTYEDFLTAWKNLNRPKDQSTSASYSIKNLTFDGNVVGQRAELKCEVRIDQLADGPIEVPLGLVGSILQGEPQFEKTTSLSNSEATIAKSEDKKSERLTYDPENGGFVARLKGSSGDKWKLTLSLLIPLQHDGNETSLPLNCPNSLTSQLTLSTDADVSEVHANSGVVTSDSDRTGGNRRIKIVGPTGMFRLTWQTSGPNSSAPASILNSLGAIHVTIDGRGVRSDARLTVKSSGGAFEQFRVRLPVGAQLLQARPDISRGQDSHYKIRVESEVPSTGGSAPENGRQVAVIELPEKQQGPVVVDLATQQSGGVEKPNQEIDLAGFEVLGAVRQYGDISLNVADDWQADWEAGTFVRQVDPAEVDASLQSTNPVSAFQYDRQPWSLHVRISPRKLRVHVTPKFELDCMADEARLAVHFAYQIFGARAYKLHVDLKGWEMSGDSIESGGLVDQDRVLVSPDGKLLLPLAQGSSHRVDVSFYLRRAIGRDVDHLEFPLPVPLSDSIGTGDLIVRSGPNIELLPDVSNSTGLTAPPESSLPVTTSDRGRSELHFLTLQSAAVLVADRTARARQISTQSSTQINISQDTAQVEQRLDYAVRNEPLSELTIEVPREFSPEAQGLEISLVRSGAYGESAPEDSGAALPFNQVNNDSQSDGQPESRRYRVLLPRPRTGRFSVRMRYHAALARTNMAEFDSSIPLVRSADGEPGAQHVSVHCLRSLTASLGDDAVDTTWKSEVVPNAEQGDSTAQIFAADSAEPYLPLTIRAVGTEASTTTVIDRVWVQTWLTRGLEQDRAAFRFRSTAAQVTVELPPELPTGEIEVLLDQKPAEVISQAHGRLVVRISPSPDAGATAIGHTLELRLRQPYHNGLFQVHRFTPPQLQGSLALSQVYWQIIVPGDEHVVGSPAQLEAVSQWQWLGSFWGTHPTKSQSELEAWAGASSQLGPAESQSQYLYAGLLPLSTISVVTGSRWIIVVAASSLVLLLAITWLYISEARRMWVAAAIAIAIVLGSITYPEASLLIGQASVLGFLLSGVAILLMRSTRRPVRPGSAAGIAQSSHRAAISRGDSIRMSSVLASGSTAPTATLQIADSKR
jgi:hypothetical protein